MMFFLPYGLEIIKERRKYTGVEFLEFGAQ